MLLRCAQLKAILGEIEANKLQDNVNVTGKYLHDELLGLQKRHGGKIENVRGSGTFLAFDAVEGATARNAMVDGARQKGVLVGGCGDRSVRLRPGLWFQPKHAAQFLDVLDAVLSAK